jgi:hypothetical protein
MKRTKPILLLALLFLFQRVMAQVKVFIEPEFNFIKPIGKVNASTIDNSLFQPLNFNLLIEPGISARVALSNHVVGFGYRLGFSGMNWKIRTPEKYIAKAGGPYNSSKASRIGTYNHQFHIGYSYRFKIKSFLPLFNLEPGDPNQKYLFRFAWFTTAGASYEKLDTRSIGNAEFSFGPTPGIFIQEDIQYKIRRKHNFSFFLGGGIQFFHKNKERFKLTLVYSQGLFRSIEFPISVSFDGQTQYQGLMSTRGSYIGLFVSYPFLVWSDKRIKPKSNPPYGIQ